MYISTYHDIFKQLTSDNPDIMELLSALNDAHTAELRMITHEIRNPLTLVYSTLQLIEVAHPEVHTFRHWDSLHEDISYMVHLLSELSSYNNGATLSCSTIQTEPFLKQIALSFAAHLESSSIEFTSYIQPDLPPLYGDALRLKEVFLNLLKNASEAFSSEEPGTIRLAAKALPSAVTPPSSLAICITDTGCGIPAARLEEIFHPFVTYKTGGTGLGLPVSKRIIEAHQGTLSVFSELGKGTTFTVLLPFSAVCDTGSLPE